MMMNNDEGEKSEQVPVNDAVVWPSDWCCENCVSSYDKGRKYETNCTNLKATCFGLSFRGGGGGAPMFGRGVARKFCCRYFKKLQD